MTTTATAHADFHASSADVRARLNHPIVDCDGHMLEHVPVFLDFLKETAGPEMVEHYLKCSREGKNGRWYALTPRGTQDPSPRAASVLGDSVGEYPRPGHVHAARIAARAARRAGARLHHRLSDPRVLPLRRARGGRSTRLLPGQNAMVSELYREHADRMTPAASIPMFTPAEAIEELEYAVNQLGLKVAMIASLVHRPLGDGEGATTRPCATSPTGSTTSRSIRSTTTIRSGRSASSSVSRPPRTRSCRATARAAP